MCRASLSTSVFLIVNMILHRFSTAFPSRTLTSCFRMNSNQNNIRELITKPAGSSVMAYSSSSGGGFQQLYNHNNQLVLCIETPDDMHDLGALLSQIATKRGDVLLLDGDLGAGKTCLSRGFIQTIAGGQEERVTSPTFLLCNSYPIVPSRFENDGHEEESPRIIHHMDLYRLSGREKDLAPLNLEQVFHNDISLIEWPQRLGQKIPPKRLELNLSIIPVGGEEQRQQQQIGEFDDECSQPRQVTLTPFGKDWEDRLEMLRTEGYVDDWIIDNEYAT